MTTKLSQRLHRSDDRVLAGVCSGIAEYFGLDIAIVRLVTVALAVLGGWTIPLYAAAWLLLPDTAGKSVLGSRSATPTNSAP